jgi:hypothetical protein
MIVKTDKVNDVQHVDAGLLTESEVSRAVMEHGKESQGGGPSERGGSESARAPARLHEGQAAQVISPNESGPAVTSRRPAKGETTMTEPKPTTPRTSAVNLTLDEMTLLLDALLAFLATVRPSDTGRELVRKLERARGWRLAYGDTDG